MSRPEFCSGGELVNSIQNDFATQESDPNARLNSFSLLRHECLQGSLQSDPKRCSYLLIGVVDSWSRVRQAAVSAVTVCLAENVPEGFFDLVSKNYKASVRWYEEEGYINLLSATANVWSTANETLLRDVMDTVFVSLSRPELPVREASAKLLTSVLAVNGDQATCVKHRLFSSIEACKATENVHALEGYLLAVSNVCTLSDYEPAETNSLLALSSHMAASVRQYVTDCFPPPSEFFFALTLRELVALSALDNIADHWTRFETLSMILERHLKFCLTFKCISFSHALSYLEQFHTVHGTTVKILIILLRGVQSNVFEMKRMGLQALPLFVQFYVQQVGSVLALRNVLLSLHKTASAAQLHLFSQNVAPLMWWYLVVRKFVSSQKYDQHALRQQLQHQSSSGDTKLIILLIACAYFPGTVSKQALTLMVKPKTWNTLLRSGNRYLQYGVDFVYRMNSKGVSLTHLVPVWVEHLEHLMSHEQCIVLTMIQNSLYPPPIGRLFSFAYDFRFKAPATVDGGEETTLGYTWLRSKYPDYVDCPTLVSQDCSSRPRTEVNALSSVFSGLYISTGTEPSALHIIRQIMVLTLQRDEEQWTNPIVDCVLARLNRISPNWEAQVSSDSESDWDTESVEGVSASEEKSSAISICEVVKRSCLSSSLQQPFDTLLGAV